MWADGIYVNVRDAERRCLLAVVGCDARGRKRFLALEAGFRESWESLKAVLLSLRGRGVKAAKLAVGDGSLGFWSALAEVYPETRAQRCWVHKTANVLDMLPKSVQGEVKQMQGANTRASAQRTRSNASAPPGRRSTPKRSSAWRRTRRSCSPSTTSRRRTGGVSGREPHRVDLRYDPAANGEDAELPEREDGAEPRASARHERREAMGAATRLASSGRRARRRQVHRWSGGKRNGQEGRWIRDGHTPNLAVTRFSYLLFTLQHSRLSFFILTRSTESGGHIASLDNTSHSRVV